MDEIGSSMFLFLTMQDSMDVALICISLLTRVTLTISEHDINISVCAVLRKQGSVQCPSAWSSAYTGLPPAAALPFNWVWAAKGLALRCQPCSAGPNVFLHIAQTQETRAATSF